MTKPKSLTRRIDPDHRGLKYVVRLLIKHPALTPRQISSGLGLEPNHEQCVGEPRRTPKGTPLSGVYKETSWSCSKKVLDRRFFFETVTGLMDHLEKRSRFLHEIDDTGGRTTICLDLFGDRNIGDVLEWPDVRKLSDLKVALGVEVF